MLDTAAGVLQTLAPIKQISAHLCAYHKYSTDPSRHVLAHHFCSHVSKEMHQCVIYDSNKPDAKLIGIESVARAHSLSLEYISLGHSLAAALHGVAGT